MERRSTTHAGIRLIAEPGLTAETRRPGPPSTCRRGWGTHRGVSQADDQTANVCARQNAPQRGLNALRETNRWLAFLTRVRWDETNGPESPTEGRPSPPDNSLTAGA